MLAENADMGIAFDGDGDRLVFVDRNGELVDGDELLYIIAQDQLRTPQGCSGVVGTLMTNLGFELVLKELKVPFARAKVGDRYVIELMKSRGWKLGGENSGHIICADVTTTGDGIVSALKVLHALVDSGRSLNEMRKGMSKFPQVMVNVAVYDKSKLYNNPDIEGAVAEAEKKLDGRGRVLLRPSGTEPVVRVMVEGEDESLVNKLVQELADVVEVSAT